jgi:hypothetical protein
MSPSSPHWPSVPLPLLLVTWMVTVVIVSTLVYAIAKAAINKADARDLPQVIAALAPLLAGLANSLTRVPGTRRADGPDSVRDQADGEQTDDEGTGAPKEVKG